MNVKVLNLMSRVMMQNIDQKKNIYYYFTTATLSQEKLMLIDVKLYKNGE